MDEGLRIWRNFQMGDLFDLIMLDTRHYDRSVTDLGKGSGPVLAGDIVLIYVEWGNFDYINMIHDDAGRTLMGARRAGIRDSCPTLKSVVPSGVSSGVSCVSLAWSTRRTATHLQWRQLGCKYILHHHHVCVGKLINVAGISRKSKPHPEAHLRQRNQGHHHACWSYSS